MEKYLEWTTWEHEPYERNADWFWVVGAVLGLVLALAAYYHILLLIIITLLGGGLLFYFALTPPREVTCSVTDKGLVVHNELFPYTNITSFWVFDHAHRRKMVILTKRYVLPHIMIPIGDTAPADIRQYLRRHIPEVEYELTLTDWLTEYLGF